MHVISTAGHVDHGKSTLVQRLTGIDPDRLREEKERGLTIDLGFAWMRTPGGREVGFVDVPGHERFIHNMLAGVGSVDTALFVVAANEGWRPQSEEHLQILEMLGARNAVVAITKADTVDERGLDAVFEQVRARLSGTALAGAEVVAVSGTTGAGIPDLVVAIDRVLARAGAALDRGRPRLFLDRVFIVNGVGTVGTGTLTGGSLRIGEHVMVLPTGLRARVRGIQSHREVREEVEPVRRIALNMAGIERAHLARGDAVVLPGQWRPTTELDVRLRTVRDLDHELSARGAYKLYVGSAEVGARLNPYEEAVIAPGHGAFARLTLTEPVVAAPFDRFVLRDTGRQRTVGGGTILDAHPPVVRGGEARAERAHRLRARASAEPDDIPTLTVAERGVVERADLGWLTGSEEPPRGSVALRSLEVERGRFDRAAAAIEAALAEFHRRQPLVRGMPREDVRAAARIEDARLFNELVEAMADRVEVQGPLLRSTSHEVVLSVEEAAAREVLLRQLADARFQPPGLRSLIDAHGEPLVRALLDDGTLVQIADDIALSAEQVEEAKALIAETMQREGPRTASDIKQVLDTSRKYAIPLLEHLDEAGFTRRRGDLRELAR